MYVVEATVNDAGGSVLIGKFQSFKEALTKLLNTDLWETTPEITDIWIKTPDGQILEGPWDPVAEAHGLEIEVRCHCGSCLEGWCSQCMGPPTYVVKEKTT